MAYILFILVFLGEPLFVSMTSDLAYGDVLGDSFIHGFIIGLVAILASEIVDFIGELLDR